jgi:DNA polymerase-3 subunit gamma/tau
MVEYLRNLMLIQMGNGEQVEVPNDTRAQMVRHAGAIPAADVLRMMRAFNAAATDTRGGWSPSLGLELAFAEVLELPAPQAQPVAMPKTSPGVPSQGKPVPAHPTPVSRTQAPTAPSAPEKKTEAKPASGPAKPSSSSSASSAGVSLEAVTKAWRQVSSIVKQKDSNVAALLNSGKLIEIKDGTLIIGFASEILQSKFNRPECLDLAQAAIREALDVELPVQAVIAGGKGALPPDVKPDGMVATAIQNGGEIVDIQ